MKNKLPVPGRQIIPFKAGVQSRAAGVMAALLMMCNASVAQKILHTQNAPAQFGLRRYSAQVGDSFSVFVQLPAEYNDSLKRHYPVVYLLDGNLYFDMMGAIIRKYAEVGMLPPVILVGIGYRDFSEMDSLRNRDYTFPKALPKYEMSVSGGADKFLSFLQTELLPEIDANYRTDTASRVLAGHSLGGYFTMYALSRNLSAGYAPFKNYIAASPSLDYNGYSLFNQLKALPAYLPIAKTGLYTTYGGGEDAEDADEPGQLKVAQTACKLHSLLLSSGVRFKAVIFSNLGHMDTAIPTFIKGLQEALARE